MNAADAVFTLHRGSAPLLVSFPHVGTLIPADIQPRLEPFALEVADTDWHLEPLYAFARELGASLLVSRVSRYCIDLNRPPENTPMYAGANNTELCPTRAFTGVPIWTSSSAVSTTGAGISTPSSRVMCPTTYGSCPRKSRGG